MTLNELAKNRERFLPQAEICIEYKVILALLDEREKLREALVEACELIEGEYCSHVSYEPSGGPHCYAQKQFQALALGEKEVG